MGLFEKMFKHTILFKFIPEVTDLDALSLLERIGELKETIPQIKSYHYGKNDDDNMNGAGYTHMFTMDFLSKDERYIYQNHPDHQAFISTILEPTIEDAIVFDFEVLTHSEVKQGD